MTNEIRRNRRNVRRLDLYVLQCAESNATEAVKAVASTIQMDCDLEDLFLQLENGFSNEAGVAMMEALTVNIILRKIIIVLPEATLGAQV
jgi:hypothetical protein